MENEGNGGMYVEIEKKTKEQVRKGFAKV